MKNKILLPILLLASMSVVACNPGNNGSQSQGSSENTQISSEEPTTSSQQEQPSSQQGTTSSQQPGTSSQQGGQSSSQAPSSSKGGNSSSQTPSSNPVVYGVKILNKDQLTGDWYKGTTRDLNIELSPAANALLEMQKKNLTVTSSDTSKVAVTGLGLTAVGKGQVTITVKYHEAVDTVTVNILSNSAIDKYGTAHEGTLEDPFTNEDAIKVTKASNYEGEDYYIKGKVASFYHAPGVKKGDKYVYGRTDGACSYFLEPATAGGEQFEVYKCYKEGSGEASYLTEDDIWVGGEAVAHGKLTKYNAQCETSAAIYANCTGNKPASRQIVTKEFANVIADGNKLADGGDSYDFWKFQGYVNTRSGNDYYLTATKGEELTTDTFKTKAIQLYFYEPASAEIAGKLLDGAKVEVTMIVKNYHSQMENLLPLESSDITVVEAGEEWKVPEPKVNARSLKDFIAGENTKAVAYLVTAQIKSFKDGDSKDEYGNMYLTDGTNDLLIYGASFTASALSWNNVNSYAFTNPRDFLTNEKSNALKVGDTITMKLIRNDFTKDNVTTIEGVGIITDVGQDGDTPVSEQEVGSLSFNKDATVVIDNKLSEETDPYIDYVSTSGVSIRVIKNTSSNDVNVWKPDYSSCRWYVGHKVTISHADEFSKIVLTCDSNYSAFKPESEGTTIAALKQAGITYTSENDVITLEFAKAVKSFDLVLDKQIRPSNVQLLKKSSGETAPLKVWDAAETKAGLSNNAAKEVKDETGDVQFTVYKLGTKNDYVEFKFTPTEAKRVVFNYTFTTKYSNATKTFFWHQDAAVGSAVKHNVYANGTKIDAPADSNPSFQDFAGGAENVVKSEASDSGELANPITVELFEFDLIPNQENVIKIEYVGSGYSTYVGGANITLK